VDHFRIVEGANDLEDAIDGTYVGEERVSETCTSRRASGEASNINAGKVCGNAGGGFVKLAEPVESRIRNRYTGFLWINSRVGKIGCLSEICLGEDIEERRFSDIWKSWQGS